MKNEKKTSTGSKGLLKVEKPKRRHSIKKHAAAAPAAHATPSLSPSASAAIEVAASAKAAKRALRNAPAVQPQASATSKTFSASVAESPIVDTVMGLKGSGGIIYGFPLDATASQIFYQAKAQLFFVEPSTVEDFFAAASAEEYLSTATFAPGITFFTE
jgi:hypothetical protein